LRVLHIIVGLNVGGAELMLQRLIRQQINDVDATVVSLTTIGDVGANLKELGVDVYALQISNIYNAVYAFVKLSRIIRTISPDVVQTWMYHADLIGGISAKMLSVPRIVWTVRSTDISKGGARATLLIRWFCAKLSTIVPDVIVYAAEKSYVFHKEYGYNADNQLVIHNGFLNSCSIDMKYLCDNVRNELNISSNTIVIGTVARFSEVKGIDIFIKAANAISKQYENVIYLLVGRGLDSSNEELFYWIKKFCLEDKFILLGHRNDVYSCLNAMDVFCSSSRTEGFPNAILEAMLSKTICVATDVGDTRLIINDNGVIVPADDHKAIASGVLQVLKMSKNKKDAMINNGYQYVFDKFSMSKCSNKYMSVYKG